MKKYDFGRLKATRRALVIKNLSIEIDHSRLIVIKFLSHILLLYIKGFSFDYRSLLYSVFPTALNPTLIGTTSGGFN